MGIFHLDVFPEGAVALIFTKLKGLGGNLYSSGREWGEHVQRRLL